MVKTNTWVKSTYSQTEIQACVEVRTDNVNVEVRDSKDVTIQGFDVSSDAWASFISHVA